MSATATTATIRHAATVNTPARAARRAERDRAAAERRREQLRRHIASGAKLWTPTSFNGLTFVDIFCGAGGSSIGLSKAGFRLLLAANHWPTAIDTHAANFGFAEHLCFPASVMVTTATGQRPINEVQVGDLVLTHRGRWRPVVRKFAKRDNTVIMRSYLHSAGIEATPNHEFYMRRSVLRNGQPAYVRHYGEPEWVPVGDALTDRTYRSGSERHAVALPASFGDLEGQDAPAELGDALQAWWLVGRWLGDGHVNHGNKSVSISCGRHEVDGLHARLPEGWGLSDTKTAFAFYRYSSSLYRWLTSNFGSGAKGKNIPGWVLTMPQDRRQALLDGYVSADGNERDGSVRADTVSKALALGVRLLAHSLGLKAGLHFTDRGERCVIQGREVNRSPVWTTKWVTNPRRVNTLTDDLHCWALVKSVIPARQDVDVYTMEVAEDHSYVADGLVVKNCADVNNYDFRYLPRGADVLWASPICTEASPAGGTSGYKRDQIPGQADMLQELGHVSQKGMERTRATFYDVLRATEIHRFKAVLIENVPDVVDRWELFDYWLLGMERLGYTYQIVSVNSAHVGGDGIEHAPQWRDRLYIVFIRKDIGRTPDVTPRPISRCFTCEKDVHGVQTWAPSVLRKQFRVGRYRRDPNSSYGQYWYTCPNRGCGQRVEPYIRPAASVIDWTDLGVRIGDLPRTARKPEGLAPKTMERIRAGLRKYGHRAFRAAAAGNTFERPGYVRAWPVDDQPMGTTQCTNTEALAIPPGAFYMKNFSDQYDPGRMCRGADDEPLGTITTIDHHSVIVPGGTFRVNSNHDDDRIHGLTDQPLAACTTKIGDGMVVPPPMSVPVGGTWAEEVVDLTASPSRTVMANEKGCEALVTPGAFLAVLRNNADAAPIDGPMPTLATARHLGLIVPYYTKGTVTTTGEPVGTLSTHDRFAMVTPEELAGRAELDAMEAYYRMLKARESLRAQMFPDDYLVLGGSGEQTMQAGNAVSCNVAEWIARKVAEILLPHAAL